MGVVARLSHNGEGGWTVDTVGCTTEGTAADYRPLILCLRGIQERASMNLPPWPYQNGSADEAKAAERACKKTILPRLQPSQIARSDSLESLGSLSFSERDAGSASMTFPHIVSSG